VPIQAILSDIGKVVVPFDNAKTFAAFARITGCSPAEAERAFFGEGRGLVLLNKYERGEISTTEYQKIIISRLNVTKRMQPTEEEFYAAYADVFEYPQEVPDEWRRLSRKGLALVAVSNICEMRHRWLADAKVFDDYDALILSYKEGLRKPSAELMVRALDRIGCRAEDALFVDDIAENLAPAMKLKINVHHFVDAPGLFAHLHSLGLRDAP